ncbi:MAG TPA: MerC family mercury resistance protein [Acidiferrobacterales bacterium]|nr:MerC family mercury resistance protein [Acidiferrobacterales bacterium]
MPRIEFIYEQSCPNVEDARAQLRLALEQAGLPAHWQEWEHNDPGSPAYARRYGSPSVLVAGKDVAGEPPSDAPSCRIYTNTQGRNRGVPDAALIRAALEHHMQNSTSSPPAGRLQLASLLPAVGAALLPKLTCPACWPAYAALLSALGVGFIDYTPYLLPLTLVFLAVTLAILAWRPRRGYAPLAVGLFASAAMLIGKFFFDSDIATYTGVVLLVGASTWNAWPVKSVSCKC